MIKYRIYLTGILILLICTIYLVVNATLVRQKEYIGWNKNAILVVKNPNYKVDFVFPEYHKMFTINNVEFIIQPYKIHQFYYDIKIDDSKLIITFITEDPSYNTVMVIYDINNFNNKKIINLGNNNITDLQSPKISLSKNFYYIISSKDIYKIDKSLSNISVLNLNFIGNILVDNNDTIFFKKDNTICTYQNGKEKIIYKFADRTYIVGWYKQNESILILDGNNNYIILDYNGSILGTIKSPVSNYSDIHYLGTIGNDSLIKFITKSGEIPSWDSDMFINSFRDGVLYNYLEYFMYNSKDNKFYRLDSDTSNLIQSKYIESFYEGQFDINKILNCKLEIIGY